MSSSTTRRRGKKRSVEAEEDCDVTATSRRRRGTDQTDSTARGQLTARSLGDAWNRTRFFKASQFVIMNEAENMVRELATTDGPYRCKLLELVNLSIEFVKNNRGGDPNLTQFRAEDVVDEALNSVVYYWAPQSDDRFGTDKAPAFASVGRDADGNRCPLLGISDCFVENDYLSDSNQSRETIVSSPIGKMTLLLFFRKIKHELLHIMLRYLVIRYVPAVHADDVFSELPTPKKYTPFHQEDPQRPAPELGNHDEEEDSGGPVLPRFNDQKLSDQNELCLQHDTVFLPLNATQVDGLLDVSVYYAQVQDQGETHACGLWAVHFSRAYLRGVLTADFFKRRGRGYCVTSPCETAGSRASSPVTARTPISNAGTGRVALWRLPKYNPTVCRGNLAHILGASSRNILSKSSSPSL